MPFGAGSIGGPSASDYIQSAREGVKGANKAVLDVMQELHEFLDTQDAAIKEERETRLMERLEEIGQLLENSGAGGLTGIRATDLDAFQEMVDEARMGGTGNAAVVQQAQQLIDQIRAQMGMLA